MFHLSDFGELFQNVGAHFERYNQGVLGPITLKGLSEGTWDLSKWKWSYKVCFTMSTISPSVSVKFEIRQGIICQAILLIVLQLYK